MGILAIPATLWRWYLQYLVYYEPDSWVASTASTFRILAIMTIFPFVLLTLLDVASYVIARTLGDPTASTSGDKARASALSSGNSTLAPTTPLPYSESSGLPSPSIPSGSAQQQDASSSSSPLGLPPLPPSPTTSDPSLPPHPTRTKSQSSVSSDKPERPQIVIQGPGSPSLEVGHGHGAEGEPADHYDEVTQARLAGVDLFSPAASQPGSPTISRKSLVRDGEPVREEDGERYTRERKESSGDESFTILEKDESFEDAAKLRQRVVRSDDKASEGDS